MSYRTPPEVPPPVVNKVSPELVNWLNIMLQTVRGIMRGNINAYGTTPLTLTPGATTTTLTDNRISGTTVVVLQPTTANAASAFATTWLSAPGKGTVVINHANAATVDRTFLYVMIG